MFVIHKGFWFNSKIHLSLVVLKFIIVGFVEEVVFRDIIHWPVFYHIKKQQY